MIKLKQILNDSLNDNNNSTFQMYHGGMKWRMIPDEILPSKKGRYEGGVGIYLTNSYLTARKYAKGGKVVQLVDIDKNYRDINKVNVPIDDITRFVKNLYGLKHKPEILQDLLHHSKKINKNIISLEILNNLIVNWESGSGKIGIEISKYFVNKGADASLQRKSGDEYWLIVFNPKIIKKVTIVDPSKINVDNYMLPV